MAMPTILAWTCGEKRCTTPPSNGRRPAARARAGSHGNSSRTSPEGSGRGSAKRASDSAPDIQQHIAMRRMGAEREDAIEVAVGHPTEKADLDDVGCVRLHQKAAHPVDA